MKQYTKLRQFYAWVGFIVTVVVVSVILATIIHFWTQAIVNGSVKTIPDINSNLA